MMFRGIFCPLDPQTAGRSGVEESFEQLGQSMMEWYFVNIVDDNLQRDPTFFGPPCRFFLDQKIHCPFHVLSMSMIMGAFL